VTSQSQEEPTYGQGSNSSTSHDPQQTVHSQTNGQAPLATFEDISQSSVSPYSPSESPVDSYGGNQDPNATRNFHLIRRQRSMEDGDNNGSMGRQRRRRRREGSMDDAYMDLSREDAMAEGTRLMMETLRDKIGMMEDRCDRLDREKAALGDLLSVRKAEFLERDQDAQTQLDELEKGIVRLESENDRLQEQLGMPDNERNSLRNQENELVAVRTKLEERENQMMDMQDESHGLATEIQDLHLEMEEMHDQFRDDEALEFRELQKELEATAKNCRILQFKLRKADRRNELIESERVQYEEKIRQLERRYESDDKSHMRELEEELRMAKEVSVRLHDELEMVEERRMKADDEFSRAQDYLRESESRRLAMQQEVERQNEEIEKLREALGKDEVGKLDIPKPGLDRPMLRKIGSQGSTGSEYDVETLMRDLADHLERENDLKEQLNQAEDDNNGMRKKVSELEDENESINTQLQKIAAARRQVKHGEPNIVTEEAHEMGLQLELMDNELKILRRKLEDTEIVVKERDSLQAEVTFLKNKLSRKSVSDDDDQPDDRPYDERIQAMAMDIDELKWKLIQKDQQVEKLTNQKDNTPSDSIESSSRSKKGSLKRSKSLENEPTLDVQKMLDSVTREAALLKEKVVNLETQNDRLISENNKLQTSKKALKIPTVQVSSHGECSSCDELKEKMRALESEVSLLKRKVKDKTERLARVASGVKTADESDESMSLAEQNSLLEGKIAVAENTAQQLLQELIKVSGKDEPELRSKLNLHTEPNYKLEDKVKDLETDLKAAHKLVKTREEENDRLLEEINGYRDDVDNMLDTFRTREKELLGEIETLNNKNNVISTLLDAVTTHSTPTPSSMGSRPCSTAPSTPCGIDNVSIGSDDVFSSPSSVPKEFDEQFLRKIAWLEQMLEEEKKKTAVEAGKGGETSSMTDDAKMNEREKEILQKELALSQKQLSETKELVKDLKSRLQKVEEANNGVRKDYDKATKDLERERQHRLDKMLADQKAEQDAETETKTKSVAGKRMSTGSLPGLGGLGDKAPAGWRWEKQQLETSVKDWKKKTDDLEAKLRKSSNKLSLNDKGKEEKLKDELTKTKEERDKLKKDRDTFRTQAEEFETSMKEIQETLERKSKQWENDRSILETDKKSAEKEANQKEQINKQKDDIISQKDTFVRQKEIALKERDDSMQVKEMLMKQKEDEASRKSEIIKKREDEYIKTREMLQCKEELSTELDLKLRTMDENMRSRDERLKEKDEHLEKLNKDLSSTQSRAVIMEKSMNEANDKLRERDFECNEIKQISDDYAAKARELEEKLHDKNDNLHKVERERDKETAALVIQREKLENQLEYISKEKKCADDEIKLLRKTLNEKEDEYGRTKTWRRF